MSNVIAPLLKGFRVIVPRDAGLPTRICAEHLSLLGARWEKQEDGSAPGGSDGALTLRPGSDAAVDAGFAGIDCAIPWYPVIPSGFPRCGTEALVQATCGLMSVHGRDRNVPRRIGLEVASMAAGTVATQGILAALLGAKRGHALRRVESSVLGAALFILSHHLALATTPEGLSVPLRGADQGPPFRTSDGHLAEIEALGYGAWTGFWRRLGAGPEELDTAWSAFVHRYLAASCHLPTSLHEAAGRHTLAEIRRAADAVGVAVCRVRSYPEVLADLQRNGDANRALAGTDGAEQAVPWTIQPWVGQREVARTRTPDPGSLSAPLQGVRVVEVTSRLQGPLAGLLLGMLGAEVIKVEPPGGDFGRHSPPLAGSFGAAYLAYNRGKRVVEIDYKTPGGRASLVDLADGADVFLHNWRSGRAEALGLEYGVLARHHPGLIYAHASGWGRTGEEPCPIAGDFLVQAHAACGDGLNPVDEPPFPSRLTILDSLGGLLACEGILAGLCLREQAGCGCRVDTSLFGGAITLQSQVLRNILLARESSRQAGRPVWARLDRPLETARGWLVVDVAAEERRRRLAEACDLCATADDAAIVERLRARGATEWEQLLGEAGIPSAAVCDELADLPGDPRVSGLLERIEDACWVPGAPWRWA